MITWKDHVRVFCKRCTTEPTATRIEMTILAVLMALVVLVIMSGCAQSDTVRSDHKSTTSTWSGTFTIPIPVTREGVTSYTGIDVPFSITNTVEEDSDGKSTTKAGFDPAAVAQIGGALAGSLKQAFPLLGALGSIGPQSQSPSAGEWLGGGVGCATIIGLGLKALNAGKQLKTLSAENGDLYDQHAAERERRAAAEAKLGALGHSPPAPIAPAAPA